VLSLQVSIKDQRGDHAPVDAALVGAGEQGVLAVEGDRADRALDHVGVDLDAAVVEEEGLAADYSFSSTSRFSNARLSTRSRSSRSCRHDQQGFL
jgi:hypothetical protein